MEIEELQKKIGEHTLLVNKGKELISKKEVSLQINKLLQVLIVVCIYNFTRVPVVE